MKNKRLLTFLLIFSMLLSCATPLTAYAKEYTEMYIKVCCDGYWEEQMILEDNKGDKYVPLSWLTYYGSLVHKENKDQHEYYFINEEKPSNFARRLFINKKDNNFTIGIYRPQMLLNPAEYYKWLEGLSKEQLKLLKEKKVRTYAQALDVLGMGKDNYVEMETGKFNKKITHEGETWVPMRQLLPLCNVKVAVQDGRLYLEHDTVSIWQVLYKYRGMDSLVFDIDEEIAMHEGLSVAGYVVDTTLTFNIFRLDFIWDTGKIKDYEDIFETYLTDNSTYLSMFEGGKSPISVKREQFQMFFGDIDTAWGLYTGVLDWMDEIGIKKAMGDSEIEFVKLKDGFEFTEHVVDGLFWFYEYGETYCNQVEDHRNMLMTVYDYQVDKEPYLDKAKEMKKWPSYKAAQNTTDKYNTARINAEKVVWSGLRDLIMDEGSDLFTGTAFSSLKPWVITTNLLKPFLKDEYEFMNKTGMLGLMDNTLQMAYDTYLDCLYKEKYDEETLNTLRLSAIMTLLASKRGYEYVYDNYPSAETKAKIEAVEAALTDFYLAAEGLELDTGEYYFEKLKELNDSLDYLTVVWVEEEESSESESTQKPEDKPDQKPDNNQNHNQGGTTDHKPQEDTKTGLLDYYLGLTMQEISLTDAKVMVYDLKNSYGYHYTIEEGNCHIDTGYIFKYDEEIDDTAYPANCSVDDYSKNAEGIQDGGSKIAIRKGVTTGMTYEEVAARLKIGKLIVESENYVWASESLGDKGHIRYTFRNIKGNTYVLTGAYFTRTTYWMREGDMDDYFDQEEYKLLEMDLPTLMKFTYGEITGLPAKVEQNSYEREIDGDTYKEITCEVYLEGESTSYTFCYAMAKNGTISAGTKPYRIELHDSHTFNGVYWGIDGGGHRLIKSNIRTGMTYPEVTARINETRLEQLEPACIEQIDANRSYEYQFFNTSDDEWDFADSDCVLYWACYMDYSRLP